jgi:hypothetical protein
MFWPFLNPEAWAEYLRTQGVDPDSIPTEASLLKCEICTEEIIADIIHIQLDPPPGLPYGRKFHTDCFVNHLCANIDNPDDEISKYALRKQL